MRTVRANSECPSPRRPTAPILPALSAFQYRRDEHITGSLRVLSSCILGNERRRQTRSHNSRCEPRNPRHASSFPRRVRPIRIGLPGTDGLRRNAPSPSVGLQILACKKLSSSQRYVNDSIAECLCHPRRQCLRQQQDCPAAHGVRPSSAATPVLDPLPRCDRDGRCTATLWRRCVRHSAQITSSRSMRTAAQA